MQLIEAEAFGLKENGQKKLPEEKGKLVGRT